MAKRSIEERFRALTQAGEGGCLDWIGYRNKDGYGRVRLGGRLDLAHRVAWSLANGPIPPGKVVMHRCDRHPCVAPEHLTIGTPSENAIDSVRKGRHGQLGRKGQVPRLPANVVAAVRAMITSGENLSAIARATGVNRQTVRTIATR